MLQAPGRCPESPHKWPATCHTHTPGSLGPRCSLCLLPCLRIAGGSIPGCAGRASNTGHPLELSCSYPRVRHYQMSEPQYMLPCTPSRDSPQLPLYTPMLGSQTQQGRLQGGKVPLPPPPVRRAHLAGRWVLRMRFLLSRVRRAGQVRAFPGATCPRSRRPLESPARGGSRAYALAPGRAPSGGAQAMSPLTAHSPAVSSGRISAAAPLW